MLEAIGILQQHLLSPIILAFILGGVAVFIRSDLKLPPGFYTSLSVYLLLAIGLKGGAALSETPVALFWRPSLVAVGVGLLIPLWSYVILRFVCCLSVVDAAAVAAHYGSVSAVTFIASQSFAAAAHTPAEGYMPALLALLEVPGVVVALSLAQRFGGRKTAFWPGVREVICSKSIVLLLGGLVIGYISGRSGLDKVAPFFVAPFQGVLVLFLLELGTMAATCLQEGNRVSARLVLFALLMPLLHGFLGAWVGTQVGLSVGGATVLAALFSSASYIAAPAAVRVSLPQANPGTYVTASLAITFPFNLAIGIPLYHTWAHWFAGSQGLQLSAFL
jgi:hypothetical protein